MRLILQRVERAEVRIDGARVAGIGRGLLVLVAIARGDGLEQVRQAARRVAELRVFDDPSGRMNLDLLQAGGEILLVPNFTLVAALDRGRRPSFDEAAPPTAAEPLVDALGAELESRGVSVARGRFGASMKVELVNDGPVTLLLEVEPAEREPSGSPHAT